LHAESFARVVRVCTAQQQQRKKKKKKKKKKASFKRRVYNIKSGMTAQEPLKGSQSDNTYVQ
jgi:hypothetical protein